MTWYVTVSHPGLVLVLVAEDQPNWHKLHVTCSLLKEYHTITLPFSYLKNIGVYLSPLPCLVQVHGGMS